jgi:hypothetical protein
MEASTNERVSSLAPLLARARPMARFMPSPIGDSDGIMGEVPDSFKGLDDLSIICR